MNNPFPQISQIPDPRFWQEKKNCSIEIPKLKRDFLRAWLTFTDCPSELSVL